MHFFLPIFLLIAYFAQTAPVLAQDTATETITSNTLTRLNYHVDGQGTVSVFLPAEILPGDTVTSRIRVDAESQKNFDGFKLRIADQTRPVQNGLFEWTIAKDTASDVTVELIGASGNSSVRISLSLEEHPAKPKGVPGRDGAGLRTLPMSPKSGTYTPVPNEFFDGIEVVAASPRGIVIFDSLVLDTRPDPVLCCSEGGPCGLTSCCVFIPSSSCLFCTESGYKDCLLDTGPPTPNPNPN